MDNQFVSRGGLKLQEALDKFGISVKDKTVLDVGSSTGGFVHCLIQNGAAKIYSVDTAYGELAWKLRNDPKVVVMERTNILHLESLPEQVDLITIDAGWTKLELVLDTVKKFLKQDGIIIALLKPHYEADKNLLRRTLRPSGLKKELIKGVLPPDISEKVKNEVVNQIKEMDFKIEDVIESPVLGGAGNMEYLLKIHA